MTPHEIEQYISDQFNLADINGKTEVAASLKDVLDKIREKPSDDERAAKIRGFMASCAMPTLAEVLAAGEKLSRSDGPDYCGFGRAIADLCRGERFFGSEWSEEICPIAARHGLMKRAPYDPELHGFIDYAEPGQEVWVWTDKPTTYPPGEE